MKPNLVCMLAMSFVLSNAVVAADPEGDILKHLHREHPRLYRTAEQWKQLREDIRNDRQLQRWFDQVAVWADEVRATSPITPPPESIATMDARNEMSRITMIGGIYKITDDPVLGNATRERVLAMAKLPDWDPVAFLTCGESMFAVAVGYDWAYELFTEEERKLVRTAIIEKGLKPGLDYHDRPRRWATRGDNWNQVCNGGMIVAALAIADEEPEIARRVILSCRKNLQKTLKNYGPDGGWGEGPGYWHYGSGYLIRAIAAMESAIGTDLGIKQTPGLGNTGAFRMHHTGPFNYSFNFSDSDQTVWPAPWMFWLAKQYNRPEYAIHERNAFEARPDIFHLIWSDGAAPPQKVPQDIPLDALFRNIDVAFFRSAWQDPAATWVGFRCGYDSHGHGHLDYGSFVLDSQEERWAIDLGNEYYVPGYFGSKRWEFFRTRNESHNTLTINGGIQNPRVRSPIIAFLSTADRAHAVGELSRTYRLPENSVRRGLAMLNRRDILVQDDLNAPDSLDVVWNMYTRTDVKTDGANATLSIRGRKLYARVLSPANAVFEVGDARAPEGQTQQPDVRSLRIRLKTVPGKTTRIAVLLTPAIDAPNPMIESLDAWIKGAEVK